MPILPENRALYPLGWAKLAVALKVAAGFRCEGSPAFPECRAAHRRRHPTTGSLVVLTIAHLDHDPRNNAADNLRVWCQRCHNVFDAPHRAATRRRRSEQVSS